MPRIVSNPPTPLIVHVPKGLSRCRLAGEFHRAKRSRRRPNFSESHTGYWQSAECFGSHSKVLQWEKEGRALPEVSNSPLSLLLDAGMVELQSQCDSIAAEKSVGGSVVGNCDGDLLRRTMSEFCGFRWRPKGDDLASNFDAQMRHCVG